MTCAPRRLYAEKERAAQHRKRGTAERGVMRYNDASGRKKGEGRPMWTDEQAVRRAMRYIAGALDGPLTVAGIAAQAG